MTMLLCTFSDIRPVPDCISGCNSRGFQGWPKRRLLRHRCPVRGRRRRGQPSPRRDHRGCPEHTSNGQEPWAGHWYQGCQTALGKTGKVPESREQPGQRSLQEETAGTPQRRRRRSAYGDGTQGGKDKLFSKNARRVSTPLTRYYWRHTALLWWWEYGKYLLWDCLPYFLPKFGIQLF